MSLNENKTSSVITEYINDSTNKLVGGNRRAEISELFIEWEGIDVYADIAGVGHNDWFNYGEIGWDSVLETFFIQVEDPESWVWWFGKTFREVQSPFMIKAILSRILGQNIEFRLGVAEKLIQERNDSLKEKYARKDLTDEVLTHFSVVDDYWDDRDDRIREEGEPFFNSGSLLESYIQDGLSDRKKLMYDNDD